MSVTKEVKRVELLEGVEGTGGVEEEDEGGGVSVEEAGREEEGTNEEGSREDDVEVEKVGVLIVEAGVVDVGVNEGNS